MPAGPRWLQDYLRCPVCLDTYREPLMLNCCHTLCSECTSKLTQGYFVRCPQCRQLTNARSLRRNLGLQQLVDASRGGGGGDCLGRCGLCDGDDAAWFCDACARTLCTSCKKAHIVTTSCREKDARDVASYIKHKRASLRDIKAATQRALAILAVEQEERVRACSVESRTARKTLAAEKAKMTLQVEESFSARAEQVEILAAEQQVKVKDEFTAVTQTIKDCLSTLTSLESAPASQFLDLCDHITLDIKRHLADIKIPPLDISQCLTVARSPRLVFSPQDAPQIITSSELATRDNTSDKVDLMFVALVSQHVRDIMIIDRQVWCLFDSEIKVYDGERVCEVLGAELITEGRGLAGLGTQGVLVATLGSGLLHFHRREWRQVERTAYSDVCVNVLATTAYAMRHNDPCIIDVLTTQQQTVLCVHTITTNLRIDITSNMSLALAEGMFCIKSESAEKRTTEFVSIAGQTLVETTSFILDMIRSLPIVRSRHNMIICADTMSIKIIENNAAKSFDIKGPSDISAADYDAITGCVYLANKQGLYVTQPNIKTKLSKAVPLVYDVITHLYMDNFVEDIVVAETSVWCLFDDRLHEYETQRLRLVNVVQDGNIVAGRGIAATQHGHLVVACRFTGVLFYHSSGCYVKTLAKGDYSSVSTSCDLVIAARRDVTRLCISLFSSHNKDVHKLRDICTDVLLLDSRVRCLFRDNTIFAVHRDQVYTIALSGKIKTTHNVPRSGKLDPRLCNVVSHSLLVTNHKHIYVAGIQCDHWRRLNVDVKSPRCVTFEKNSQHLYVSGGAFNNILYVCRPRKCESRDHVTLCHVTLFLVLSFTIFIMYTFTDLKSADEDTPLTFFDYF